jgi:hypothetical protein
VLTPSVAAVIPVTEATVMVDCAVGPPLTSAVSVVLVKLVAAELRAAAASKKRTSESAFRVFIVFGSLCTHNIANAKLTYRSGILLV